MMVAVISREVNAERMVLFGWSRAILLQMAHPLIAAGVADHSHVRSGALVAVSRLRGTIRSMLSLAFGDRAAYERSIGAIRAIHSRVHGQLRVDTGVFRAGTRYSAEDPALVLWVHATFIDSALLVFDRLIRPLSIEERDAYCQQGAGVAIALGAHAADVPLTWSSLERYLQAEYASGRIVAGADARMIAEAVLFPPLSLLTWPAAWVNRLVTLGFLPPAVRDQYRYGWNDTRDRQLARTITAMRTARRLSPRMIALWPGAR